MKILIVEDNRRLCSILKRGFTDEGYVVDTAYDGEEGEYLALDGSYDIIILDILLPRKDGIEVCQAVRSNRVNTPILLLTAKDDVESKVRGLDSGADDYVVKPFAFSELVARIRALLRRQPVTTKPRLQIGDLVLDTVTREVWRGKRAIELTNKEYIILSFFMRHPNAILTRTMIEEHAWQYEFSSISNLVDVHIGRLRRKIDRGEMAQLIQTVRGAGYRLKTP